ncbi:MAG: hypothetical protein L3K09_06890, partial [Thermoplasmata archaeon]|nr:hypothetical protein [Thermoplasmata archaeon]
VALVVLLVFADVPAFLGTHPLAVLLLAGVIAVLMVVPLRFPKIRRGNPLRGAMTVTAVALVGCILPLQFQPAQGSPLFDGALLSAVVATAGILVYYLVGPFTVPAPVPLTPMSS